MCADSRIRGDFWPRGGAKGRKCSATFFLLALFLPLKDYNGLRTHRIQDSSDPRHFGTSVRGHFGTVQLAVPRRVHDTGLCCRIGL